MTPRARRLVALVTLGLALAVVLVLTLRAFGVPLAIGPQGSPSPAQPSLTPTPSVGASPSLEEALAALEADVADIRDLPPADIGPPEFITRDELERRLADELADSYPPEEVAVRLWIDTFGGRGCAWCLGYLAPGSTSSNQRWLDSRTDEPFEQGWVVRRWCYPELDREGRGIRYSQAPRSSTRTQR